LANNWALRVVVYTAVCFQFPSALDAAVSLDVPGPGAELSRPLTVLATEPNGQAFTAELWVDGVLRQSVPLTSSQIRLDWDTRSDPPGEHTVEVRTRTLLGATSAASAVVLTTLAPPSAPSIARPSGPLLTGTPWVALAGHGEAGTLVEVLEAGAVLATAPALAGSAAFVEAEAPGHTMASLVEASGAVALAPGALAGTVETPAAALSAPPVSAATPLAQMGGGGVALEFSSTRTPLNIQLTQGTYRATASLGTGQSVSLPASAFNGLSTFTLEGEVRFGTFAASDAPVFALEGANGVVRVERKASTGSFLLHHDGAGGTTTVTSPVVATPGQWSTLALVCGQDALRLVHGGTELASIATAGCASALGVVSAAYLGRRVVSPVGALGGYARHIRLSVGERYAEGAAGAPKPLVAEDAVALWSLADGNVPTAANAVSGGPAATYAGAVYWDIEGLTEGYYASRARVVAGNIVLPGSPSVLYSTEAFARTGSEVVFTFQTPSSAYSTYYQFFAVKPLTAPAAYASHAQYSHGINFSWDTTSSYCGGGQKIHIFEKGVNIHANNSSPFAKNAWYQARIVPTSNGAQYYFRALGAPTWTLLHTSTGFTGPFGDLTAVTSCGFSNMVQTVSQVSATTAGWSPVSALSASPYALNNVKWRATLSRPSAATPSPELDAWVLFRAAGTGFGAGAWTVPHLALSEGAHTLHLRSTDSTGVSALSPPLLITVDTSPPGPADNLAVSVLSLQSAQLTWQPPPGEPIASYRVYRSSSPTVVASSSTFVASTADSQFVEQGLAEGTWYWAVEAVDTAGTAGPLSATVSVTLDAPPPAPSSAAVQGSTAQSLDVAWTPVASVPDLAGYRVYADDLLVVQAGPSATVATIAGLSPASKVAIGVCAVDLGGNESPRATALGYTWLQNPVAQATPQHEALQVSWDLASPSTHVSAYRVYAQAAPFVHTGGLVPVATLASTQTAFQLVNLTNGQPVYVAVAAVSKSQGQDPAVVAALAAPEEDHTGPIVQSVAHSGVPLFDGAVVAADGQLEATVDDPQGVAWVRFLLDGALLGADTTAAGGFVVPWALDSVAAGAHVLGVQAFDTLGNETLVELALTVLPAPPPAPAISSPSSGSVVGSSTLLVKGTGKPTTGVQVSVDGDLVALSATVGGDGQWSTVISLQPGEHTLVAMASNSGGSGPPSAAVTVLYDAVVPSPPKAPKAFVKAGGLVRLEWLPPAEKPLSGVAGYHVYRASTAFDSPSAATRLTPPTGQAANVFVEAPPSDGVWHYRLSTLSGAGVESALSAPLSPKSDATPPKATAVSYAPLGPHVAGPGALVVGPGPVEVSVTMSEALSSAPFFSLTPSGGVPLSVSLHPSGGNTWSGSFQVSATTPSGPVKAVLSARDVALNSGNTIEGGQALVIDTEAPAVVWVATDPPGPIRQEPLAPVVVGVSIEISEPETLALPPELTWRLTHSAPEPTPLTLAQVGPTSYAGSLVLPSDAGLSPEELVFAAEVTDALGNVNDNIESGEAVEVYQGALPALATPVGLTATSQASGIVALSWKPVFGAAGYRVLCGPSAGALVPVADVSGVTHAYDPGADGTVTCAVASLREVASVVAQSAPSGAVSAVSDRTPPLGPPALSVSIGGQGAFLSWSTPPFTEPVTYTVYRAGAPPPAEVAGLPPLLAGISVTSALDPAPVATLREYSVVAVDAVGNVSPASPWQHLDVPVLPVPSLSVLHDVAGGAAPLLQWSAAPDATGYQVRIDGAVVAPLVTTLSFVDATFGSGPRTYGVTVVGAEGTHSAERLITLPSTSAVGPTEPVGRGVLSAAGIWMEADETLVGAVAELDLQGQVSQSEPYTLVANTPTLVTVPVAAPAAWPESVWGTVALQWSPNAGETVRVVRPLAITTAPAHYDLQLELGDFVAGGAGKARFTFTNTGSLPVELVTAAAFGTGPSPHLRAELLDAAGNLLLAAAYSQTTGGVVQKSSGWTVAQVAPGASFQSAWMSLAVPANAPQTGQVRLLVSSVHWGLGSPNAVSIAGPAATAQVSLVAPPYLATITSATPSASWGGEPVTLHGHAFAPDGAPESSVPVLVAVSRQGFVRKQLVTAAADGTFAALYTPLPGESGVHQVWASHPSITDTSVDAEFVVQSVSVAPGAFDLGAIAMVPLGAEVKVTVGASTALTGLRLVAEGLPAGVEFDAASPISAAGPTTAKLGFEVLAHHTAAAESAFAVRVESDQGVWAALPVALSVVPPAAAMATLQPKPTFVSTGVARGALELVEVSLTNVGLAPALSVELELLNAAKSAPAPSWMALASPKLFGPLQPGAAAQVSVSLSPDATTQLTGTTPVLAHLRVAADGVLQGFVPLYVHIDDSGLGAVSFKVFDIYTGTLDSTGALILGLSGATVRLEKTSGSAQVLEGTTDATGEVLFEEVAVGTYSYRVGAAGHDPATGNLVVKPGLAAHREVGLNVPAVSIEWSVEETAAKDSYQVVMSAVYETDIPAPVLVTTPPSVGIPAMLQGQTFTAETVTSNEGGICVHGLQAGPLEPLVGYHVERSGTVPAVLCPGESYVTSYKVVRTQAATYAPNQPCVPPEPVQATGYTTCGTFECIYGKDFPACAMTAITTTATAGKPCPSAPGSGSGQAAATTTETVAKQATQALTKAQWGWPGPPVDLSQLDGKAEGGCDACQGPELSPDEKFCCEDKKEFPVGSAVHAVTGGYADEAVDLVVTALGMSFQLGRVFVEGRWIMNHEAARLMSDPSDNGLDALVAGGVRFERASEDGVLYRGLDGAIVRQPDGRFVLHLPLGERRVYDARGFLLAELDRFGAGLTYIWEGDALAEVRDWQGELLVALAHDAQLRLQAAVDRHGRTVAYTWDGPRLVQVTREHGGNQTYEYDQAGRLVKKETPLGVERNIAYDALGRVASVTDHEGAGRHFSYAFDPSTGENSSSVVHSAGFVVETFFGAPGKPPRRLIDGYELPEPNNGSYTLVDGFGRTTARFSRGGALTSAVRRDVLGRVTSHFNGQGVETQLEYDERGQLARFVAAANTPAAAERHFEYDAHGYLVKETWLGYGQAESRVWEYGYDSSGNLTWATGPGGQTTSFEVGPERRVTAQVAPNGNRLEVAASPDGLSWTRTLTPPGGPPVVLESQSSAPELDSQGQVTGWRVSTTDAAGRTSVTLSDVYGNVREVVDAFGRVSRYTTDLAQRLTAVELPDLPPLTIEIEKLGAGVVRETTAAGGEVLRVVERDALGRTLGVSALGEQFTFFYEGLESGPSEVHSPGRVDHLIYDASGRMVGREIWLEEGALLAEAFAYQGPLLVAVGDAHGGLHTRHFDVHGRLVGVRDPLRRLHAVERDVFGQARVFRDPLGRTYVAREFTADGRVSRRTVLGGAVLDYTHGPDGLVQAIARSDGSAIDFSHDARGRVVSAHYVAAAGSGTADAVASFEYDAYGRPVLEEEGDVATEIAYDPLLRSLTTTVDFGAFSKTIAARQDALGRLVALDLPEGDSVEFHWGNDLHLDAVVFDPSNEPLVIERTNAHDSTLVLPAGAVVQRESDALGQLRDLRVTDHEGSEVLAHVSYYDRRRPFAVDTEHGRYEYAWDAADRLTFASHPTAGQQVYAYDAANNRVQGGPFGFAIWHYDDSNRLLHIGPAEAPLAAFEYDAMGRTVRREIRGLVQLFEYDAAGRLAVVRDAASAVVATYTYDARGRRVRKQVGGQNTFYLWSPQGLVAIYDESGAPIARFTYYPASVAGSLPMTMEANGVVGYYVLDGRGAPRALISESGALLWRDELDAFGASTQAPGAVLHNPLRWSAQLYDEETGLHYNGARYYDPLLGRYLTPDPLYEASGTYNLYAFADQDPIRRWDTGGLQSAGPDPAWLDEPTTLGCQLELDLFDTTRLSADGRDLSVQGSCALQGQDLTSLTGWFQPPPNDDPTVLTPAELGPNDNTVLDPQASAPQSADEQPTQWLPAADEAPTGLGNLAGEAAVAFDDVPTWMPVQTPGDPAAQDETPTLLVSGILTHLDAPSEQSWWRPSGTNDSVPPLLLFAPPPMETPPPSDPAEWAGIIDLSTLPTGVFLAPPGSSSGTPSAPAFDASRPLPSGTLTSLPSAAFSAQALALNPALESVESAHFTLPSGAKVGPPTGYTPERPDTLSFMPTGLFLVPAATPGENDTLSGIPTGMWRAGAGALTSGASNPGAALPPGVSVDGAGKLVGDPTAAFPSSAGQTPHLLPAQTLSGAPTRQFGGGADIPAGHLGLPKGLASAVIPLDGPSTTWDLQVGAGASGDPIVGHPAIQGSALHPSDLPAAPSHLWQAMPIPPPVHFDPNNPLDYNGNNLTLIQGGWADSTTDLSDAAGNHRLLELAQAQEKLRLHGERELAVLAAAEDAKRGWGSGPIPLDQVQGWATGADANAGPRDLQDPDWFRPHADAALVLSALESRQVRNDLERMHVAAIRDALNPYAPEVPPHERARASLPDVSGRTPGTLADALESLEENGFGIGAGGPGRQLFPQTGDSWDTLSHMGGTVAASVHDTLLRLASLGAGLDSDRFAPGSIDLQAALPFGLLGGGYSSVNEVKDCCTPSGQVIRGGRRVNRSQDVGYVGVPFIVRGTKIDEFVNYTQCGTFEVMPPLHCESLVEEYVPIEVGIPWVGQYTSRQLSVVRKRCVPRGQDVRAAPWRTTITGSSGEWSAPIDLGTAPKRGGSRRGAAR
jgi:RHS repeat-associated protein